MQNKEKLTSATLKGRAEALQIILDMDAEEGLHDYCQSHPCGDSGDYSISWDIEKLKELFQVNDEFEESPVGKILSAVDGMYWGMVAQSDDMRTLKELVSQIIAEIESEKGVDRSDGWTTLKLLKTWVS
jgi:hypothetical protein